MNQPIHSPSAHTPTEVFYPESDGQPMGETGFHVVALLLLHQALKSHLAASGRTDSYVASDMFLYYEEGNPKASKAPDVMVILGVDGHQRRTFKTWEEHAVPTVIFEISSDETWREDLHNKRDLYARLGVAEYFLFDPLGDCLVPRLQGFRLQEGRYVPLGASEAGTLESRALGLRLVPEEGMLRLINARTGEPILTEEEKEDLLEKERIRGEHERQRADALAAEVARLQALLDQSRKQEG